MEKQSHAADKAAADKHVPNAGAGGKNGDAKPDETARRQAIYAAHDKATGMQRRKMDS